MVQTERRFDGVNSTKIFFTDLNGKIMVLPVNGQHIDTILQKGIGFDGSSIAGITTVDDSDRLLFPIAESFQTLTFGEETVGFFVGEIRNAAHEPSKSDPRALLASVVARAESEYGVKFLLGPEHEFFLLDGDAFDGSVRSDRAGYFHADPEDRGDGVRRRITEILNTCGIPFEKAHHEVSASQHEINLPCAPPLAAADRTVLFNYVTRKVAAQSGYRASFIPKPFDGQNRNAFHIHLSMQDRGGRNLFYDGEDPDHLSQRAKQFMGGIIKYARQASIVMASTFNSYKAYVMEREAPVVRGWGLKNRSSMVRIPHAAGPDATRIELRNPDPAGNVYLQMAVLIAMGLQGMKEDLDCGEPDKGSTYRKRMTYRVWDRRFLPKCMFEALVEAEKSTFLKQTLGDRIYRHYMDLKIADWEEHRTHVTPREYEKYL